MVRTRDELLAICPAFGVDDDGDCGIQADSDECRFCKQTDSDMFAACEGECAAEIAKREKLPKEKERQITEPKRVKKKLIGPIVPEAIVELVLSGPMTQNDIIIAVMKKTRCTKNTAEAQVRFGLVFGCLFGVLRKDGNQFIPIGNSKG